MSDSSANAQSYNATHPFSDSSLVLTTISDFSPGIYRYSLSGLPSTFSSRAPIGSASSAFRCINQPGIGLVPFYSYTKVPMASVANSAASLPFTNLFNTGFGVAGNFDIATGTDYLTDLIWFTYQGQDSAQNLGSVSQSYLTNVGTLTPCWNWYGNVGSVGANPFFSGMSFSITALAPYGGYIFPWMPALMCIGYLPSSYGNPGNPTGYNSCVFCIPDPNIAEPYYQFLVPSGTSLDAQSGFTHTSRVFASIELSFTAILSSGPDSISLPSIYSASDPPGAFQFPNANEANYGGFNTFALENNSGISVWGSVSTGELVLINSSGGAVVVYGDAAFPSSVVKLPAVRGAGNMIQAGTMCDAGMVYITQSDGVWAWNGGNTSVKVSAQIPDDACIRQDLFTVATFGQTQQHDALDELVFFPNNWVFDSANNSWWNSEDPAVNNFVLFARAQSQATQSNTLYAMLKSTDGNTLPGTISLYPFVKTSRASNWLWISNPIPGPTGALESLQFIEIIASNPTQTNCVIEVTPTCPIGQVPFPGNNPQVLNFDIPALTSNVRVSTRLGYTDFNVCLSVAGINSDSNNAAPVLHQISLGFTNIRSSGTN